MRPFLVIAVVLLCSFLAHAEEGEAGRECISATSLPVCVAKTWVNCALGPAGSFCEVIGLPHTAQQPPIDDEQYVGMGSEARRIGLIARKKPWTLTVGDFGYMTGTEWRIEAVRPVTPERLLSVSVNQAAQLAETTEVMISARTDVESFDYSVFVKRDNSGWRFVAWHGAAAVFGGGFNDGPNANQWRDLCDSKSTVYCESFAHGVRPWSVKRDTGGAPAQ